MQENLEEGLVTLDENFTIETMKKIMEIVANNDKLNEEEKVKEITRLIKIHKGYT
jgi:hypothetical protein